MLHPLSSTLLAISGHFLEELMPLMFQDKIFQSVVSIEKPVWDARVAKKVAASVQHAKA